jgi:hypothetical protein
MSATSTAGLDPLALTVFASKRGSGYLAFPSERG